jgi:NADPH2:quinone reductase
MTRVVRVHHFGAPEALIAETIADVPPAPGEVRIRQSAIGVNFTDVHARRGDYQALHALPRPVDIGMEAVGRVEAVGAGVTRFAVGDRIAYATSPLGAYADARNMPAERCVRVPDGVADDVVAATLLKGLTVQLLLHRIHAVRAGETVVFHAAAGGVGTIAGQWLAALGAHAIGIVGTRDKVAIARAAGYAEVYVDGEDDWATAVRARTGGAGVPVVYDSVGRATWDGSIACLARTGKMVCFGNTSGLVPPISVNTLRDRGSLWVTWMRFGDYTATTTDLDACAEAFFAALRSGIVKPSIQARYALADAADAHRLIEARATRGSIVLLP